MKSIFLNRASIILLLITMLLKQLTNFEKLAYVTLFLSVVTMVAAFFLLDKESREQKKKETVLDEKKKAANLYINTNGTTHIKES